MTDRQKLEENPFLKDSAFDDPAENNKNAMFVTIWAHINEQGAERYPSGDDLHKWMENAVTLFDRMGYNMLGHNYVEASKLVERTFDDIVFMKRNDFCDKYDLPMFRSDYVRPQPK